MSRVVLYLEENQEGKEYNEYKEYMEYEYSRIYYVH